MKVTKLRSGKTYKPKKCQQGRGFDLYCRVLRKAKPDKTRQQKAKLPPPPPESDEDSVISEAPDTRRRNYSRLRSSRTETVISDVTDVSIIPDFFFAPNVINGTLTLL